MSAASEGLSDALNAIYNNPLLATQIINYQSKISNFKKRKCSPWTDFSCPFLLYVILLIITIIVAIIIIIRNYDRDRNGNEVSREDKLAVAITVLIFHLLFGILIGYYIYKACSLCAKKVAWGLFWLAILLPFIFLVISLLIFELVLNVELLFQR